MSHISVIAFASYNTPSRISQRMLYDMLFVLPVHVQTKKAH